MSSTAGELRERLAQQEAMRRIPRRRLYVEWVLGNALAALLGGFVAFPVARVLGGSTIDAASLGGFAADMLLWIVVGFAQWFVLQRYEIDVQRGRWIFVTAAVRAVPLVVALNLTTLSAGTDLSDPINLALGVFAIALGGGIGFVVGLAQMWPGPTSLGGSEWTRYMYRWAWLNAIGMAAGLAIYMLLALPLMQGEGAAQQLVWDFSSAIAPALVITVTALLTGAGLIWPDEPGMPMAMLALSEVMDIAPSPAISDRPWSRWRRDARWTTPAEQRQLDAKKTRRRRKTAAPESASTETGETEEAFVAPTRPGLSRDWWRVPGIVAGVIFLLALIWYISLAAQYLSLPTKLAQPPARVGSLAYSPDGKTLAIGFDRRSSAPTEDPPPTDSSAQLWDVAAGKLIRSLPGGPDTQQVSFSPDGKLLAVAVQGDRYAVDIWDVATGEQVKTLPGFIGRATFSADGRMLATTSVTGVAIWNVADWTLLNTVPATSFPSIAFSGDGKLLVVGAEIWDVASGELLKTFSETGAGSAISPDGKWLAVIEYQYDAVDVWRVADRQMMTRLTDFRGQPQLVVFSPDGAWLATGTGAGDVRLWRSSDWQPQRRLSFGARPISGDATFATTALTFAPDGSSLAVGGYERVDVWRP